MITFSMSYADVQVDVQTKQQHMSGTKFEIDLGRTGSLRTKRTLFRVYILVLNPDR